MTSKPTSLNPLSIKERMTVIGEYLGAAMVLCAVIVLFALKKMSNRVFVMFWIGFGLASIWEFGHEIAGSKILRKGRALATIPGPVYAFLHAAYDAMLFLGATGLSFALAYLLNNKNVEKANQYMHSWSPWIFVLIFVYGVGQELIVEHLFNNKWWFYTVAPYNPVLIKPNITCVPVLEWAIAITLYYIVQNIVYQRIQG